MPSQPSRLFAVLRPTYHCRCGIPKGTKQGCRAWLQRDGMHGCRKLASFGKGGRARLQRRDQFHEPKSNPELFPYHISLYDLWDETNPWLAHQQLTPHPATAKKEARLSRCHASPLMRADGASLAHLRAQQPGRFFSLPEISIQYIMHLGLPSGEISESDLRRFTPPACHLSTIAITTRSHCFVCPYGFPPAWPRLFSMPSHVSSLAGSLGANLPRSCHISQAVALCQHWQCLWLWLHWLGYPIRQCVRPPGRIACRACRIDAHYGAIALFSCARQTCTARYSSEARSFPAGRGPDRHLLIRAVSCDPISRGERERERERGRGWQGSV